MPASTAGVCARIEGETVSILEVWEGCPFAHLVTAN